MLTDSSGNIVAEYGYDSQGNLLFAIGSIENNFLFSGQQYDSDAGLYYHRARYRDTNTGRFTQMDLYAGRMQEPQTLHKYNYAHNDPVNLSDPSGKFSIGQVMTTVNVVGALTTSAVTGYRIRQFSTGERELTAKEVGFTVLIAAGGAGASKLISMIAKTKKAKDVLSALEGASATAYRGWVAEALRSPSAPLKRDSDYQRKKKRKLCRKRAVIEPIIGHLKHDYRLQRNWLKGSEGDATY